MKPRKPPPEQDDLLRARLVEMIDMRHELVKLETLIDWHVSGRLHPHIGHILPFDQVGEGMELLRSRKSTGKVVISI